MTEKQFILHFIKNNDLLCNKKIQNSFLKITNENIDNKDREEIIRLLSFINNIGNWCVSCEGRLFWETLHYKLIDYAIDTNLINKENKNNLFYLITSFKDTVDVTYYKIVESKFLKI